MLARVPKECGRVEVAERIREYDGLDGGSALECSGEELEHVDSIVRHALRKDDDRLPTRERIKGAYAKSQNASARVCGMCVCVCVCVCV